MSKKANHNNVFAVTHIGSNFLQLQVSQLVNNKLNHLERLKYPVSLGHDVFYNGEINFENVIALSEVLEKYHDCLAAYPICKSKVISCSAMRYASNKEVVQDIFKTQLDIDIQVLEENEEKALLYFESLKSLSECEMHMGKNCLFAYIGTGSIGLAMLENGKVVFTQNIPTGALKMQGFLGEMRRDTENFYEIIEDYVGGIFAPVRGEIEKLDEIILIGSEIERLTKLTHAEKTAGVHVINKSRLSKLFKDLRKMTLENIALHYGILEDEAATLYYTLFIANGIMDIHSSFHRVLSPDTDIVIAKIRELCDKNYEKEFAEFKRANALHCAERITKDWKSSPISTQQFSDLSCRIFDKLISWHGMENSWKMVLKLAAKFVRRTPLLSFRSTEFSGYIQNIELFGTSQEEMSVLSLVISFIEAPEEMQQSEAFLDLDTETQLIVSKLTAIAGISLALSRESLFAIRITSFEKQRRMVFHASTQTGDTLAKWAFKRCAPVFQSVFGIQPVLTIKRK